jgi:hypothetical protein
VPELTIAAVEVEAVRGPAGRFPYPVQWQAVPVIPHGHGLHAAIHVIASQSPGTCPMAEYLYRIEVEHRCCSRDIDGALMPLPGGRLGGRRGCRDGCGSRDAG